MHENVPPEFDVYLYNVYEPDVDFVPPVCVTCNCVKVGLDNIEPIQFIIENDILCNKKKNKLYFPSLPYNFKCHLKNCK